MRQRAGQLASVERKGALLRVLGKILLLQVSGRFVIGRLQSLGFIDAPLQRVSGQGFHLTFSACDLNGLFHLFD